MINNKYNRHYSRETVINLIDRITMHKTGQVTLKKEWYEALIIHLEFRNLSENDKIRIDYILSVNPLELENEIKAQKNTQLEEIKINKVLLKVNLEDIISAGRYLKNIVYTISFSIIINIIGYFYFKNNISEIDNAYNFFGIVFFINTILILVQLFSAGDKLEKSVIDNK